MGMGLLIGQCICGASPCDWAQSGWSLRFGERVSGWLRRAVVWRICFITNMVDQGRGLQLKVASSPLCYSMSPAGVNRDSRDAGDRRV